MFLFANADALQMTGGRAVMLLALMWLIAPVAKPSVVKSNLFEHISQCPTWVRSVVFVGMSLVYLAEIIANRYGA